MSLTLSLPVGFLSEGETLHFDFPLPSDTKVYGLTNLSFIYAFSLR